MEQLIENGTFIKIDIQGDELKDVNLFEDKSGNVVEYKDGKYSQCYIRMDNESKLIYINYDFPSIKLCFQSTGCWIVCNKSQPVAPL